MSPIAKTALTWARKVSALSLPVGAVAVFGGPLAAWLAGALVASLVVLCWVLSDPDRTHHLVELIQAVRGTAPPADQPLTCARIKNTRPSS